MDKCFDKPRKDVSLHPKLLREHTFILILAMKKNVYFLLALLLIGLSACDNAPKFKVQGEINGAEDKMLYLEASGLDGIVALDSAKLGSSGSFSFAQKRPESPEFYRLRLDNKVINFAVDSTETVSVKAEINDFATAYRIEGSENNLKINLYNMVIKGMKNTRTPRQQTMEIPEDKIKEASIIDIQLKDLKGNTRSLTDLKGKVVLIDFTVYNNAMSAAHNLALRELYNKYASQGFEIYQISLDGDEHFWKTSADNLPWVCVRDANGAYSSYISLYNVTNLPSVFLVNRNNELSARGENIKDLDEAIKKLL